MLFAAFKVLIVVLNLKSKLIIRKYKVGSEGSRNGSLANGQAACARRIDEVLGTLEKICS